MWFLAGNPVVGDFVRTPKAGISPVQLLFWSGQSFDEADLQAEGKFKAAQLLVRDVAELDGPTLGRLISPT